MPVYSINFLKSFYNYYYEKIGDAEPVKLEDLPFDIPDNWTWIRQKNICWLDNGKKTKGTKLPYLEAKVIRGKSDPTYLDSGVIVGPECKVILVDGENSGEIMTPPFEGYMGSTFKIFSAVNNFNYEFLLFIFLLNKERYKNSKIGAAIPHLNKELFKESFIAVPPLNEQARIVSKIMKCETLITQYSNIEEKLSRLEEEFPEKLKKSILQYAIEGKLVKQDPNDEPASVLLERIKQEKERLIKEGKIKRDKNESYIYQGDDKNYYEKVGMQITYIEEEIIPELPLNWSLCRLKSIIYSLTDGTHTTPKYTDYGIPFVSVKDLSAGYLSLENTKHISVDEHKILSKRCHPVKGDILITKVGTTGIPVLVDTDVEFSLFVSVALLKYNGNHINPRYFIYLLKSPLVQQQAVKNTRGVGNKNWVLADIERTLLVLPPLNEQERIVTKLDTILKQV